MIGALRFFLLGAKTDVPRAAASATMFRSVNPWVIAAIVVIPTFMEVLDTTIANVALRYIAGGLSAAVIDSEWVITSYLAANATILPISGWLSSRLGRRNYFIGSIVVFTFASALCGFATSLEQLICFRILQGLAGGGLQPSSQGVLLDAFPQEKQGSAMTVFGVAALIAPVIGPTLGGYLTVNFDWRWIFYINIPIGAFAALAAWTVLEDPPYLKLETAEHRKAGWRLDGIGLGVLAITVSAWEVLMSKGQEWDWFGDPFWRVQTLAIAFAVGLAFLFWYEMRIADPVVNFRPLAERNFLISTLVIFSSFGVLYAASTTLPNLLQTLFGYDAFASGLVLSPSGIFAVATILIVGPLITRGWDARIFVACGLVLIALGCYWMSLMTLAIGPWQAVWPRVVMIIGLSMIFAPLNVAAFLYIPRNLRGAAVGLFALLRNEGGSVGTSVAQTIEVRREQFHTSRIGEFLDPLNPAVNQYLNDAHAYFYRLCGDSALADKMALQTLSNERARQAASLAYFDDFFIFAVVALLLIGLVLLMKRSVAAKSHLPGAE
ncbi:MDR family MFS transporter [Blastopirellula marina]|uniref:Drug resistance transporter, EmrB/QacA family protein n=1 Tax=Blastopirellula marina DSM 3645 TaxID=314230 RepID=A3ZY25_9BACT|nr:MDR family MFS transporter [Blastopirellula marina]EAQ78511.1 drug resistance transporter, EmrB/QacA family protein [Blastopirellula marina DSM 3645]